MEEQKNKECSLRVKNLNQVVPLQELTNHLAKIQCDTNNVKKKGNIAIDNSKLWPSNPGIEVKEYPAGIYIGKIQNGKRCGYGEIYFNKDRKELTYKGEWENDRLNGFGAIKWRSNETYSGEFNENKPTDNGYIENTKFLKQTNVAKQRMKGSCLKQKEKYEYTGQLIDGVKHGYCTGKHLIKHKQGNYKNNVKYGEWSIINNWTKNITKVNYDHNGRKHGEWTMTEVNPESQQNRTYRRRYTHVKHSISVAKSSKNDNTIRIENYRY